MKSLIFKNPNETEMLPYAVFVYEETTTTLVTAGVFQTLIRAEYWAESISDYLESRGISSIVLDGDSVTELLNEAVKVYPDDWDRRVLN